MPIPKTRDETFDVTVGDLKEAVTHLTEALQDTNPTDTIEVSVWDVGVLLVAFWRLNDADMSKEGILLP